MSYIRVPKQDRPPRPMRAAVPTVRVPQPPNPPSPRVVWSIPDGGDRWPPQFRCRPHVNESGCLPRHA
jgi:hypothetical protein